ncbi:MAG: hypothetical protein EXR71_01895, partial [Myxococcales bacterium]|nr:hypothetical protein [Myxococcales bacterium]
MNRHRKELSRPSAVIPCGPPAEPRRMKIELDSVPSFGMAVVTLDQGEQISAESGAMVAMSSGMTVNTTFNGKGGGGILDLLQAALVGL